MLNSSASNDFDSSAAARSRGWQAWASVSAGLRPVQAVMKNDHDELAEIPADGCPFAARDVATSRADSPLLYVVHIDDHQSAEAKGWTGGGPVARTEIRR
ncbi:hypothetical protein [Nocardia sp. NPDC004711]